MAHGYGLELTPLHTLTLYNAVANNGRMIRPVIVKSLNKADREIDNFEAITMSRQICTKETLTQLKAILEGVVESGTAKNINTSLYKIAGKTGTAVTLKNGRYTKEYNTSFVGYFPARDPLYSIIVVIENPKGFYQYGNNVAAPVFREIADKIYASNIDMHQKLPEDIDPLKGIFPVIRAGNVEDLKLICNNLGISNHAKGEKAWVRARIKNNSIEWRDNNIITGLTPDVTGMTLRDALFVLENQGLRVKYEGMGRVVSQSISPGVKAAKGNWINLKLG
jgi:cell division protein FtsI (penicillin-binding protein 3)